MPLEGTDGRDSVEDLLTRAQAVTGAEYLRLELDARQRAANNDVQKAALRRATSDADPIKALMARVVLGWVGEAEADYRGALEYLVGAPIRLARTPIGVPEPLAVEAYLTRNYAERAAPLLALRLLKEGGWPRWQVVGVLFYLEAHPDPITTSAVIRFAIETSEPEWRRYAVEALEKYTDPALAAKLRFEIARANTLKLPIPPEVRALGAR